MSCEINSHGLFEIFRTYKLVKNESDGSYYPLIEDVESEVDAVKKKRESFKIQQKDLIQKRNICLSSLYCGVFIGSLGAVSASLGFLDTDSINLCLIGGTIGLLSFLGDSIYSRKFNKLNKKLREFERENDWAIYSWENSFRYLEAQALADKLGDMSYFFRSGNY